AIVEHHLARAGAAGRAGAVFRRTDAREAIGPVLAAVRGLSGGRDVAIEASFHGDAHVAMDAQDLQEVVGNLLDNAVKWARSRVVLTLEAVTGALDVLVDDDGPGIPDAARAQAMARGTQLDTASPGSGLGLAIVRDIAALYRIGFDLEASPLGGVRARLRIPRAAAGNVPFTISSEERP
ncbi:MAG TPA: ATP-binding protein, partial [Nevskiaceae bacterium]|nr:ATP-binding protein [Nevskiaceae bacterium]